ncbi:MAG: polysaccharide deacetylase family protein, partial [Actinomycetota bacterium]|nr:polysaccharide deacetylase family protein [Actinomycetota bacterium]
MDSLEPRARRAERARADRKRAERRRRLFAVSVVVVCAVVIGFAVASSGGSNGSTVAAKRAHVAHTHLPKGGSAYAPLNGASTGAASAHTVTTGGVISTVSPTAPGGAPGTTPVPVLMYHVIAAPPPGAPFPGLYVPASEFTAQMQALKGAGWHAVTLDQLRAYWTRGVPLGPGKPVVLTFDNGYHSQYAEAFSMLQKLGWVADENMQLTGLPPSQGGLTDQEIKAMVAAGWELDTQGISH